MECALIEEIGTGREADVEVDGHRIHLSSLDRIVWPKAGFSKRDLIAYYIRASEPLLRYLKDRPLSFLRFPTGIQGQSIFQRHYGKGRPEFVETVCVYSPSNKDAVEYILCNNLPTLVWLGQISALELHPWHSRIVKGQDSRRLGKEFDEREGFDESVLNYPDYIVCDLDPNTEDRPFERVCSVALMAREALDEEGLQSYVKTSGKRGLHVYVPLARKHDYDNVRAFAKDLGRRLEERAPDEVTLELSLNKRPKKVFFDYGINSQAKTLACPLSPRGGPLGTVSFPLEWERLEKAKPQHYTIGNAPRILAERGDPWRSLIEQCQELPKAYVG